MSFLSGRIRFERFRVGGQKLSLFDQRHVEILEKHAIGQGGALTADGTEVGFTAGEHLLDLDFRLEKNIVNDALHFGLRVDTNQVPADVLKAYTQLHLAALSAENPSGFASRQQRQQARQAAQEQCQLESQTGKFRRMKQFSALWDLRQQRLLFAGTSLTAIERFLSLFKEAFGRNLERTTSGTLAHDAAAQHGQGRSLEDLSLSAFWGSRRKIQVSWVASQYGSRDFLGNEFLLWLWWICSEESDTITLRDGSTALCMMNRTLTLECPLNESGKETIAHEAPPKLPEAHRAVASGKLPRKTGLLLVRHEAQYELSLSAETLSVSGASLPGLESDNDRAMKEERIDQIRHLNETLDLLYDAFVHRRLSSSWADNVRKIRTWLEQPE